MPVGQYRTCWQSTAVTACPDLLILSALNMKANGLLENSVHFYRSPWSHSQEKNFGTRLPTPSCTIEAKSCGSSTLYCWHELWPHTDRHTDTLCEGTSAVLKKSEESKDATDFVDFSSYRYFLSWQVFKASSPSLLQCAVEWKVYSLPIICCGLALQNTVLNICATCLKIKSSCFLSHCVRRFQMLLAAQSCYLPEV